MTELKYDNQDGANWQARAVLGYLQSYQLFPDKVYSNENHEFIAQAFVGRFENCREQGYVLSVRYRWYQKNYAFYEHRNCDRLCIVAFEMNTINTPSTKDVLDNFKSNSSSGYDVSFEFGHIIECGDWIIDDIAKFVDKVETEYKKAE